MLKVGLALSTKPSIFHTKEVAPVLKLPNETSVAVVMPVDGVKLNAAVGFGLTVTKTGVLVDLQPFGTLSIK